MAERIQQLDDEIREIDGLQTRKEVADLYFQKAHLLLEHFGLSQEKEEIALALYHAGLRYLMADSLGSLAAVIKLVKQNELELAHPKLSWLLERIQKENPRRIQSW